MKLRYKIVSVVMGVVCTALLVPGYITLTKESLNTYDMFYVTAAHIPHEDIVGYTFIYEDTSRDTAYYIKDDYEYTYPRVGESVYFSNTAGTVESIKDGVGFYVTPADSSKVYKGLSGARVKNSDGDIIAFISSAKGQDKILCVSIK